MPCHKVQPKCTCQKAKATKNALKFCSGGNTEALLHLDAFDLRSKVILSSWEENIIVQNKQVAWNK